MVKVENHDAADALDEGLSYRNAGTSSSGPAAVAVLVKEEEGSTSGDLKSYFVGMGFSPVLVDKVIKENGSGDENLLLEALIGSSKSSPEASESWENLSGFENEEMNSPTEFSSGCKQENEELAEPSNAAESDKKSYLAMMDFTEEDIDLAVRRLGPTASVPELVEFILSSQAAGSSKGKMYVSVDTDDEENEEITTATLFGTMDRTLSLLQMGFTEKEVSSAIDKFGSEVPISELAAFILASRMAFNVDKKEEDIWDDANDFTGQNQSGLGPPDYATEELWKRSHSSSDDAFITKASSSSDAFITKVSSSRAQFDCEDLKTVKKAKSMSMEGNIASCSNHLKQARQDDWEQSFETKPDEYTDFKEAPYTRTPSHRPNVTSRPPYFFYANVVDVSNGTWRKLSQFLYTTEPEFTNSQFFSALIRKEGYLHNLPTEGRFRIVPEPPMTIEAALPHTKKWWPSWDTRKQLNCISSENTGVLQLCDRIGKMMTESQGFLSKAEQTDIIHQCKRMNLVWVGNNKLKPLDPEQVESILGYPKEHTEIWCLQPVDRLAKLKYGLQTDTIGYHLSVLKRMYPDGLRVLSIFSGIGGAEVALHRLGVRLTCVVSVESCEINRDILKGWWQRTGQTGVLKQIAGIEKLTSQTLEKLMNQFGGFDVIIATNPGDFIRAPGRDSTVDMDFSLYFEFVRVLQRVRSVMGKKQLNSVLS